MNDGMYHGAGLSLQGAELGGQMQVQQVSPFANEYIGKAGAAAGLAVASFTEGMNEALAYKQLAAAKQERGQVQQVYEEKLKQGLEAAPGSSQSFLLADGSRDMDKLNAWRDEYVERVNAVRPPLMGMADNKEWDEFMGNAELRAGGLVMQHVGRGVRRVAEAALREHKDAGDTRAYCAEVDRQVGAGILTEVEGRTLKRGVVTRAAVVAQKGQSRASMALPRSVSRERASMVDFD